MSITISAHALRRYQIRTGRRNFMEDFLELKRIVNQEGLTWYDDYLKVRELGYNVTRYKKGDRYVIWFDDILKEDICGVVSSDGMLITILTKQIHQVPKRVLERVNVKLLEGRRRRDRK